MLMRRENLAYLFRKKEINYLDVYYLFCKIRLTVIRLRMRAARLVVNSQYLVS